MAWVRPPPDAAPAFPWPDTPSLEPAAGGAPLSDDGLALSALPGPPPLTEPPAAEIAAAVGWPA
jgi:hypothetical protein